MSKLKISSKPYVTVFIILAILAICASLSCLFFPAVSIGTELDEEPLDIYFIDGFTNPEKFDAVLSHRVVHASYTESMDVSTTIRIASIFCFIFPLLSIIIFPINVMRRNKVPNPVRLMKAQIKIFPSLLCATSAFLTMFGANKILEFKGGIEEELTSVTTYMYIPAIICVILFIVATIFYFHYKGALEGKHAPLCAAKYPVEVIEEPEKTPENDDEIVAAIAKYKDLYDKGAITKEEFEAKKSELLKK